MADVQATGNFYPLPDHQLYVPIVPGPPTHWKAVTASQRRPGEPFFLGLKVEDQWGNPSTPAGCQVKIDASANVAGLPEHVVFDGKAQTMTIEDLTCTSEGVVTFTLSIDGDVIATAGPLVITDADHAGYWGDLHGQSGETIGIGRIEDYVNFARNKAFLDAMCHQGNDFQIKKRFWDHLNEVTADWNEPGRFTTFLAMNGRAIPPWVATAMSSTPTKGVPCGVVHALLEHATRWKLTPIPFPISMKRFEKVVRTR